jgi:RNA polymerase sigma factor (sigma-70 family)
VRAPSHEGSKRGVSPSVRLPPFQSLVDAHAGELHRFLVASVGPTEAEDCLQETLLSALRAYPALRDASHLRAWLYTIAQHKATDTLRRHQRHRVEDLDGVEPALLGTIDTHEPADDELWARVRGLPPKQRAAVVHRFVLDLAYREIGERLGCTEEAARQSVATGLRRLRMEVDR